jgi:hypothetical protein
MPHIPTLYQLSYREFTLRPESHWGTPGHFNSSYFHIGTQEYSLVSRHYREYYLNWFAAVGANNQSIQWHSQGLQAGLDCWRNGYLQTYLYFDDSFLHENYYQRLPTGLEIGILWYACRTPSTIYATAKVIIQLCPHSPSYGSSPWFPEFESQTEGRDIPAHWRKAQTPLGESHGELAPLYVCSWGIGLQSHWTRPPTP